MSKTYRRLGLITLGALSALTLGSCGNQANNNTLVIGLECNYSPFNWTEASPNEYTLAISNQANAYADGYDIQFAKRASEELGMDVKIVKMEWDNLIPQLNAGQINCIIAGMTDTKERREAIDFTNEYYRSELVLVTSKAVADNYASTTVDSQTLSTLLNGKGIVSQIQTVTNSCIETFVTNYGAVHQTPVDTFATASSKVNAGTAFAMTAEYPVAQAIVKANSNLGIIRINQDILGEDNLSELGVSIGVKKGNQELVDKLNNVLAKYTQEMRNADMTGAVERSGD
ncbi:MAG: transporter substrate-binding domain-containing protein [Acholeplasmatales bacterium]|nr:transporter substrate-binding domain-containing protein [Acholeplasmatales bacterium]